MMPAEQYIIQASRALAPGFGGRAGFVYEEKARRGESLLVKRDLVYGIRRDSEGLRVCMYLFGLSWISRFPKFDVYPRRGIRDNWAWPGPNARFTRRAIVARVCCIDKESRAEKSYTIDFFA